MIMEMSGYLPYQKMMITILCLLIHTHKLTWDELEDDRNFTQMDNEHKFAGELKVGTARSSR